MCVVAAVSGVQGEERGIVISVLGSITVNLEIFVVKMFS